MYDPIRVGIPLLLHPPTLQTKDKEEIYDGANVEEARRRATWSLAL